MMAKRFFGFLAGCLLLLAPSAHATDWMREGRGDGIQLGPVLLYPALSVSGTYDDNIHLVSKNPDSGWFLSVTPALKLALPVRRFYLNLEGGLDYRRYFDVDQDDFVDWFVGAAIGADFPGGLSFRIADKQQNTFLIGTQEYGVEYDQGVAKMEGEDYSLNTLSATLAYALRNVLRFEVSGLRTDATYSISDRRERVESTLQGDLYWKFRPKISALLEGSYRLYEYDTNTAQDNSAIEVALGLTWDLTAKSTGVIKGGLQWKSYDARNEALGTEDASYYTVAVGVKHSFTQRTLLALEISRASQESDFPQNPYYLRNMGDLSLTQRLTSKVFLRLSGRYGVEEYPNKTTFENPFELGAAPESGLRTDTTLAWSATLGFDATRWLSFELQYGGGSRDSTFDTFDYDVTRVSLGAKATF